MILRHLDQHESMDEEADFLVIITHPGDDSLLVAS